MRQPVSTPSSVPVRAVRKVPTHSAFGRIQVGTIIAVVIVLVAALSYFGNTSINPVTGEKQHVALTPDQEIALGLQSAPQMAAQMGGDAPPSDPRTQTVQRIGNQLLAVSSARKGGYPYAFHLLADTNTVNAFALPGGQVFITMALYDKLPDEAALAGVLGHEVGHVVARHAAEHMAKQQLGQMLGVAAGAAASDRGRGYEAAMVAQVVNSVAQLKFSRSDELEADKLGIQFMQEAGYDPMAMISVMEILQKVGGRGGQPEFLLTHPYPEDRIKKIREILTANPPPGGLTRGQPLAH